MSAKKSIWITYAWDDNKDGDVDFVAQELIRKGLDVKLDRWNLTAGKRLWEQIESFIQDPSKSDSWLLYATQTSLGNARCKEEFAYALDRALNIRGSEFPIIALFPSTVDTSLIPAGIKTRLFVSITDPDWKERIVAAAEKREPSIQKPKLEPYVLKIYHLIEQEDLLKHEDEKRYAIEVRPRGGTWSPFIAAIPSNERVNVLPKLRYGAANRLPRSSILFDHGEGVSGDGKLFTLTAANEATPTQSYYIFCNKLPSVLIFGVNGGSPQYQVKF